MAFHLPQRIVNLPARRFSGWKASGEEGLLDSKYFAKAVKADYLENFY